MTTQIVGIGEALWDVFADGARFGGAPANFACAAANVGKGRVRSFVVSKVGRDDLGRRAVDELSAKNVDTSFVQGSS